MSAELAEWCKKKHKLGKHAIILADGYDRIQLSNDLRKHFDKYLSASAVDFIVDNVWWVSIRPLLDDVPVMFTQDSRVSVCVVRANE